MDHATIRQLAEPNGEPAVSILCPLDARIPGNAHDPRLLAQLRDRAAESVEAVLSHRAASAMIAQIDEAIASIDLRHPSPGVAVLVAPGVGRVVALDDPVEPHVVVGKSFASHDLVAALLRRAYGRVLVLSRARTRCIDVAGREVTERRDHGFPVVVEPPTEADTPHGDFPLDEHERDEAAKFVFRAVDEALSELQRRDPRPLVLIGTERDLAYFEKLTSSPAEVIGHVYGNHDRDAPGEIERHARPLFDEHAYALEQAACGEVREAMGGHAVSGIVASWSAARAGRGHRLVVEDGFRFPARLVDGALQVATGEGPNAFDAVDETVEAVIRHDGEVIPVRRGSLSDLGRIALQVRD